MFSFLITLLLCLISASSRVFLKKGFNQSNPVSGMVSSLWIGFLFLAAFAVPQIIIHLDDILFYWKGLVFFAGIGLIAPPIVRYLTYIGIDRLGVSRADPMRSVQPVFALVFSGLVLQEKLSPAIWIATFIILYGVILISTNSFYFKFKFFDANNLYPLTAAILAGLVTNLRKMGIEILPYPLVGAFIASLSALIVFLLFVKIKKYKVSLEGSSKKFFLISGFLTALTDVLDLVVLQVSKVSIVAPLLAATPLFVVLLSALFLKKEEKLSFKTILGAVLIFIGVQLVFREVVRS